MHTQHHERIVPPHNLFGDHGPRCLTCSGLGHVLRLPTGEGKTRYTSRCSCNGTGIDQDAIRAGDMSALLRRMDLLEAQLRKKGAPPLITSKMPRSAKMSRQYWMELIAWATADGVAVANTTTEAIVFPNIVIPANYMQDGRRLRLSLYGRYSNVVTAVPDLTLAVRWGGVAGTVLATSGLIRTGAAAIANGMWDIDMDIQTRANGATGSVFATGKVMVGTATVPTMGTVLNYGCASYMGSAGVATPAAVTVDLTADTALSITADWSAANASNTITGHQYGCESMN